MQTPLKYIILLCFMMQFQTTEAQFFEKLKNKIENKVEEEIDNTVDNQIDSVFEEDSKEDKEVSTNNKIENKTESKSDFGSTVLTHSKQFGTVQIDELSQVKAIKTDDGYQFTGSWWSHEADIFDGFNLIIKTSQNLKHEGANVSSNARQVFKIPEEASLKLGYDPQLLYNKKADDDFRAAVSDDYQNYDISKGEVSVDVLSDDVIQISFSGKVSLRKIIRHKNSEDYTESYFESTLIGAVDGISPKFIDNTTIQNTDNKEQNSGGFTFPQTTTTAAIPGVYEFTFETVIKVTNLEDNQSYTMSYLLNPNANYMAIKADMSEYSDDEMNGESIIVMDDGNSHIFVETAGMKMQMSSQMMGGQQSNPTEEMANYDYSKIRKTGKTKTILGATCHEYVMSDSDVRMELWVAPEINLPNWFVQNKEVLDGHIMEYTIDSKDGNMKSETVAIKDNISRTIDPKGYKKMF